MALVSCFEEQSLSLRLEFAMREGDPSSPR